MFYEEIDELNYSKDKVSEKDQQKKNKEKEEDIKKEEGEGEQNEKEGAAAVDTEDIPDLTSEDVVLIQETWAKIHATMKNTGNDFDRKCFSFPVGVILETNYGVIIC